jgi:hypothetical protein
MPRWSSLWRNLVHRDLVDRDLDDEMRAKFNLLVEEKVQGGMPPDQARRAATLEFGSVALVTQQVRDQRAGACAEMVFKDVRYGLRMVRRNPGFTLVVVLSLAAGIGANSAIFSVANALMLTTVVCVLALGLACLGLYGLMSYGVTQRTAELGLRLALGAPRSLVLWPVFRESLCLIGVGLAVGVPAVLAAPPLIGAMLFDVRPNDPATLMVAMLLLFTVGAGAGYLRARRASRVDPLTALRHE